MCFSNLPVEFDEDGNPTLADEAEDVDRPGCGCDAEADLALDETDPRAAYDAIVDSVPETVREHLAESSDSEAETAEEGGRSGAEGD